MDTGMEVSGNKFNIRFEEETATIHCTGILDARGSDGYREIAALFKSVVDRQPDRIILDVRKLEFLNSSGITAIGTGLVIPARDQGVDRLVFHCSTDYPWQRRSMTGLARLMPGIELIYD